MCIRSPAGSRRIEEGISGVSRRRGIASREVEAVEVSEAVSFTHDPMPTACRLVWSFFLFLFYTDYSKEAIAGYVKGCADSAAKRCKRRHVARLPVPSKLEPALRQRASKHSLLASFFLPPALVGSPPTPNSPEHRYFLPQSQLYIPRIIQNGHRHS